MAGPITYQNVAREAAKMLMEDNAVIKNVNTDREGEFTSTKNGYKPGDTIKIKVPPVPVSYVGASFAGGSNAPAGNMLESSVNLTLQTQVHVPLQFTAREMSLELGDFKERYLRPSMNSLGSIMNADLLTQMKNLTPNVIGTWGTVPATRTVFRNASSVLDRFLAPSDNRSIHISSDANDALAEVNATLFHKADEIRGEFADNAIGRFAEMDFFTQQSLPLHTNGAGNTAYIVNGASQVGSGLIVSTGAGAISKGSILTIANVNSVHPITGVDNGKARQFVVTADYAGGAGTISIYPSMSVTSATAIGTLSALAANGAAVTIFGTLSQAKRQNIAFHKDAFAVGFAPLDILPGCEGYTANVGPVSVRVMSFGDGRLDLRGTRLDIMYGLAGVRPDHSIRVTE
jgi:hypothetical protein